MIRVLFICHGNICRSPMAEFIMKDMIQKRGLTNQFHIASAATSMEEIGNPVYPPARSELAKHGITVSAKCAIRLERSDYKKYDYLIGMEKRNITNMMRILGTDPECKVHRLLDFVSRPRDISDPWYSGKFGLTYDDIKEGCEALLLHILKTERISE
ncbi:MAG: low molecular weight phosphotyrosine protein phosphatase [Hespellia sp.]|nr:low molecular weight phosphotyrosine protein phosphatase [Hespellia sp.]